jgi:hypothetical protein
VPAYGFEKKEPLVAPYFTTPVVTAPGESPIDDTCNRWLDEEPSAFADPIGPRFPR